MLTINNNLWPKGQFLNFGMKLKPNMLQNNIGSYNTNLYPNLSGVPNNDIFIKNTNSPKEISFGSSSTSDVEFDNSYYKKFNTEVQKKWDEVWDWTSKRPRYQEYFKKLNIEKPKLVFVTKQDYPDYSPDNPYLKYLVGAPTKYNWINNTIIVDTDYCQNMILVSQNRMALIPYAVTTDFVHTHSVPDADEDEEGTRYYMNPYQFEDLEKRSLDFALSDSVCSDVNYFSALDPKEAAVLTSAFLAHEAEHAVAMHVILNTADINMQKFKNAFNNLDNDDMLPPYTTEEHWTHTYPYKYRKKLSSMAFNKDAVWKIRDENGNSLRRVSHDRIFNEFFDDIDRYRNLLELDARYASISYLNRLRLDDFNYASKRKLGFALGLQEKVLNDDIERRLRMSRLAKAAEKVKGKKPKSAPKKTDSKSNQNAKKK